MPEELILTLLNEESGYFHQVPGWDLNCAVTGAVLAELSLNTHIVNALPKFMLKTPGMKRRAKAVDTLLERVQSVHTPAQRAGCPRNLADAWLSLHASDPQFVPESNLRFALSAALIASVYLGDAFSFALFAMASQPDLYERIRSEADALFDKGNPNGEDFTPSAIDVTHRFLMECMRLYPIVPMSIRNVMNSCVVEGYELPVGSRIYIAQTAAHYMNEVFPDPFTFDIDRYLPPRNEHHSPGYAPYGLGTHTCLGFRWMELQLAVNVLMVAHYFRIEVSPANYKLRSYSHPRVDGFLAGQSTYQIQYTRTACPSHPGHLSGSFDYCHDRSPSILRAPLGCHPIFLIADAMLVAPDSLKMLITTFLTDAIICGSEPVRTWDPSSPIVTSLTKCRPFSIPQGPRMSWSSLSADV